MAYYTALVSTVQFLEEMSLSEHQDPNSLFEKPQITSLYETFCDLQETLEDYSPNDDEADGLLGRIRDAACLAQDLIECYIPDAASQAGRLVEKQSIKFRVPYAAYQAKCNIVSEIRQPGPLEEIIHVCFWHFVSACHSSKPVKEEVVFTVRKGYEDLLKLTNQLGSVVRKGYLDLEKLTKEVDSIDMGQGYLDLVKLKEELDSIVVNGYEDLVRLKEEVDAIVEDDLERLKELVDSIVGRGYQVLGRVKEKSDSIVGKGDKYLLERLKEAVYSIAGWGYRDLNCVKGNVDSILGKRYKDLLETVKEEIDSILEDLTRIKAKGHTTHQDDLQARAVGAGGVSTNRPNDGTAMVGFQQHLKRMKEQLFGESSRLEVISIVGMGGIGKTTLARHIFNDELIDRKFDFRVWVTVSQSYHLRNILLSIVDSLNMDKKEIHGVGEGVLKDRIYKFLFGQRYLIIMDDAWDLKIWDDVKWIFPNDNKSRSRIIVTTRQSDVASLASESDFINQIPILEHDQSWDLFREKGFCPPELEDIGRSIVKNCRGLPLAIVVVAGLLSKVSKTRYDWEQIARGVSSSVAQNDEHFTKILSLSYDYLPHHLKPCFLYFGAFPEDYKISVSRLVKLWVAEGFVKPIASKSMEEAAEEYLEELVKRNLVLINKRRSNGKFRSCSVHDLLRDLCSERARKEHFLLLLHNEHIDTGHIHRFSIHPDSSSNISMQENDFLHVRSFLSFGDKPIDVSSHPSNFKRLRVLDAPRINFTFSCYEFYGLLHLRYLVLWRSNFPSILPSVSNLQNLQTLIVAPSPTKTMKLPFEIWMMPQLRHIMIDKVILPPPPSSGVALLGMLQTLHKVQDFRFDSTSVKMIPNLKKLKLVMIYGNSKLMNGLKTLVDLHQLETLDIFFSTGLSSLPSTFSFPVSLIKLTLKGCNLPWKDLTIAGSLPNLQILKLKEKSFVGGEWEPVEGEFPKLKYLLIERLYDLEQWGAENFHFPCLEQLHIRYCEELEIPSKVGDIPTLQLIELHYCGSFVESRALEIQQEQEDVGNNGLQVRCIRKKVR